MRFAVHIAVLALGCVSSQGHAQRARELATVHRLAAPDLCRTQTGGALCRLEPGQAPSHAGRADSSRASSPWAILASAALPGAGQALLRQDRLVAYLSVEAYAWVRYVSHEREGRRQRATYRDLASNVARVLFSDVRPVGAFDYYERMEKFVESGAFDVVPGGDIDPEPDTTTSNGSLWLLARRNFWSDPFTAPPRDTPEYRRAEEFYRERAVPQEFRWSWRNAQLEYDVFRRTIRQSNVAFRSAIQDLGIVIANHALSTVDAFVTVRLRRRDSATAHGYEVWASIPVGR